MGRQGSHHEEPEWIVADRSEIDAVHTPHFTKGYWSRALNYLKILPPHQVLKLLFHSDRIPCGIESSIHAAATRKGMPVSVYVRGASVYIRDRSKPDSRPTIPVRSEIRCAVCGDAITPKPGAGKQYVCAGTTKKKSECQRVWRCSRELGISIEQAKQRRASWAQGRNKEPR